MFFASSTVLLKVFWEFLGGRTGRSTCVLLAHRTDSRPPYLVKRLLYKWKTSGGTNSGWPLAGSHKHKCSPLRVSAIWDHHWLWNHLQKYPVDRVWSPWDWAQQQDHQHQGRPRARHWRCLPSPSASGERGAFFFSFGNNSYLLSCLTTEQRSVWKARVVNCLPCLCDSEYIAFFGVCFAIPSLLISIK